MLKEWLKYIADDMEQMDIPAYGWLIIGIIIGVFLGAIFG
jgi:hypothetical protein